jgi:hypothetical protein
MHFAVESTTDPRTFIQSFPALILHELQFFYKLYICITLPYLRKSKTHPTSRKLTLISEIPIKELISRLTLNVKFDI